MNEAQIVNLAARWQSAELERKMRKRERRLAWLIAFKAGVKFVPGPCRHPEYEPGPSVAVAETPEAEAALKVAQRARVAYLDIAARAGALRGQLTRALRPYFDEPVADAAIAEAYDALCAREEKEGAIA